MLNQNYDYERPSESDLGTWDAPGYTTPTYTSEGRAMAAPHTHALATTPQNAHALTTPPVTTVQTPTVTSELLVLGSLLQSMQNTQQQHTYLLREMDARLARLEDNVRVPAAAATSFERSTWWAIWGLLMLVMGAALAVIIVLLLLQVQFR